MENFNIGKQFYEYLLFQHKTPGACKLIQNVLCSKDTLQFALFVCLCSVFKGNRANAGVTIVGVVIQIRLGKDMNVQKSPRRG